MMEQHDLGWARYLVLPLVALLVLASLLAALALPLLPKRWRT